MLAGYLLPAFSPTRTHVRKARQLLKMKDANRRALKILLTITVGTSYERIYRRDAATYFHTS